MAYKRTDQSRDIKTFDFVVMFKYIILSVIFCFTAFCVKSVVMSALHLSPSGKVGNAYLTLYEVHNSGAAFNLFSGKTEIIIAASFITIVALICILIKTSYKLSYMQITSMAELSAGIIMNMVERIEQGYVIDYIHLNIVNNFPVFNIPDVMIFIGAVGLILSLLSSK